METFILTIFWINAITLTIRFVAIWLTGSIGQGQVVTVGEAALSLVVCCGFLVWAAVLLWGSK